MMEVRDLISGFHMLIMAGWMKMLTLESSSGDSLGLTRRKTMTIRRRNKKQKQKTNVNTFQLHDARHIESHDTWRFYFIVPKHCRCKIIVQHSH